MKPEWYILGEDGQPTRCAGAAVWDHWMRERPGRHVLRQNHRGSILVSTVFLGTDHLPFDNGRGPVLFETMVLDRWYREERRTPHRWDQFQMRYRKREHAERGHVYVWERFCADGYPDDTWNELAVAIEEWETGKPNSTLG